MKRKKNHIFVLIKRKEVLQSLIATRQREIPFDDERLYDLSTEELDDIITGYMEMVFVTL